MSGAPFVQAIPRLPLLVPAFNNPYYIERFCRQMATLDRFDIFVFDNGSTYPPLLELYEQHDLPARVIRLGQNLGPRLFWQHDAIYDRLPQFFCVSDPDIAFCQELPADFLNSLLNLTTIFQIGKAGFALDISNPAQMTNKKFRHANGWKHVWESEAEHWLHPIPANVIAEPAYFAVLDTTFALYNKAVFNRSAPFNAIRVAGRFTARHLPWYRDTDVPAAEQQFYARTALYSYYASDNVPLQLRRLFAVQDAVHPANLPPSESPL